MTHHHTGLPARGWSRFMLIARQLHDRARQHATKPGTGLYAKGWWRGGGETRGVGRRQVTRAHAHCGQMGEWTDADVQALLEMVKKHGTKWTLIAKSLPGSRNPMSVKQKHYKLTLPKEKRDQQLLTRRARVKNMSAEELEKKRKKRKELEKKRANMSAEELEKKRKYDRQGGMSAERLEKKRKTSAARSDANTQLRQEILNTASDGTGTCECSDEDCFCRRKAAILLNLTRTRLPQNWSCE
jgi:hypothetical protein